MFTASTGWDSKNAKRCFSSLISPSALASGVLAAFFKGPSQCFLNGTKLGLLLHQQINARESMQYLLQVRHRTGREALDDTIRR